MSYNEELSLIEVKHPVYDSCDYIILTSNNR